MGLVSNIPVTEEVALKLNQVDLSDPNKFLDKTVETFRASRRYSVDPHQKQHLFGKTLTKPVEPLNQKLYK